VVSVASGLPERKSHQDGCQHQENPIIPSMLFGDHQLNSQHILETSKACCKERHHNQKDKKILLQRTHLL
jgi:hypothetical protein